MIDDEIYEIAMAETKGRVLELLRSIKDLPEADAVDSVHTFILDIIDNTMKTGFMLGCKYESERLRKVIN